MWHITKILPCPTNFYKKLVLFLPDIVLYLESVFLKFINLSIVVFDTLLIKKLKNNNKLIVSTSSKAEKAVNYITREKEMIEQNQHNKL